MLKSSFPLFALLCITPALLGHDNTTTQSTPDTIVIVVDQQGQKPTLKPNQSTWGKYARSIVYGTAIGTLTGASNGVVDGLGGIIVFPITWYLAYASRKNIVESVAKSLEEDGDRHCKIAMNESSWVASWVSYFAALGVTGASIIVTLNR